MLSRIEPANNGRSDVPRAGEGEGVRGAVADGAAFGPGVSYARNSGAGDGRSDVESLSEVSLCYDCEI